MAKLRHERAAAKRVPLECKTQVMVITLSPHTDIGFEELWSMTVRVCVCFSDIFKKGNMPLVSGRIIDKENPTSIKIN